MKHIVIILPVQLILAQSLITQTCLQVSLSPRYTPSVTNHRHCLRFGFHFGLLFGFTLWTLTRIYRLLRLLHRLPLRLLPQMSQLIAPVFAAPVG